jgi:hypothetical protein
VRVGIEFSSRQDSISDKNILDRSAGCMTLPILQGRPGDPPFASDYQMATLLGFGFQFFQVQWLVHDSPLFNTEAPRQLSRFYSEGHEQAVIGL